jgi:hypothetical protein
MYMLSPRLRAGALRDAESFVAYMMRLQTYEMLLVPPDGGVPRYLLPARQDSYKDNAIVAAGPLYPKFYSIISRATPITGRSLNARLRQVAPEVDAALQSDN